MSVSSEAKAVLRPGLLARCFPSLGNLGWPILHRQLRADLRRARFFVGQFLCLSLLGGALMLLLNKGAQEDRLTAIQLGQSLFDTFFIVQYLIVLLVFPAFSSTAFSEERSAKTLDLLLVTTLRPVEIVLGKLLASATYCLLYVLASIPILSIAFLLGGIQLEETLLAYGVLLGLTLLVCMMGVAVSSLFTSSVRATVSTYFGVLLLFGSSWYLYREASTHRERADQAQTTLIGALLGRNSPEPSALLFAGALAALALAYLFVLAANRIRPAADDRSSSVRLVTLVSTALLGLATVPAGLRQPSQAELGLMLPVFLGLVAVASVFPTEDAEVSRRNQTIFSRWKGLRYPLRIFAPGAFWGMVYSVFLSFLAFGSVHILGRVLYQDGQVPPAVEQTLRAFEILPWYISAFSAFGFFLACHDFTPVYSRLTSVFTLVIVVLLPLIFQLSREKHAPLTSWEIVSRGYCISPFTLWSLLGSSIETAKPQLVLGYEITSVARVVFAATAVILAALGCRAAHRKGYPMLTFPRARVVPRRSRPVDLQN